MATTGPKINLKQQVDQRSYASDSESTSIIAPSNKKKIAIDSRKTSNNKSPRPRVGQKLAWKNESRVDCWSS